MKEIAKKGCFLSSPSKQVIVGNIQRIKQESLDCWKLLEEHFQFAFAWRLVFFQSSAQFLFAARGMCLYELAESLGSQNFAFSQLAISDNLFHNSMVDHSQLLVLALVQHRANNFKDLQMPVFMLEEFIDQLLGLWIQGMQNCFSIVLEHLVRTCSQQLEKLTALTVDNQQKDVAKRLIQRASKVSIGVIRAYT